MNLEEFNILVEKRVNIIRRSLADKGKEYANDNDDRLITFKSVANLRRTTTVDAVGGMMSKQIDSLFDMIKETTKNVDCYDYIALTEHLWEERIKDIINYMILLDAVLQDYMKGEDK